MKENHFRLDSEWELMKTPSQTLLIIVINICLAGEKMKESEGKSQASDLKTLIPKFLKREKRKGAEGERVERLRNENGIEGLAEIWVFLDYLGPNVFLVEAQLFFKFFFFFF